MNYLSINQNIWHTATVSGILKTGLREVCRPLNVGWAQCRRRVAPAGSQSQRGAAAVPGAWWDVYLWCFHRRDSIFSRLHFYNLRASLRPRKANYNVFHSFSQFIATLYWASSPVRLFSFNKMLWKIAVLPGLPGTSETRLWGTAAVWSCSRRGLINQMLGLVLPFFFFTFANNMHFWVILWE